MDSKAMGILAALILTIVIMLSSNTLSAQSYILTYQFPLKGFIITLRIIPAGNVWSLDTPYIIKYSIEYSNIKSIGKAVILATLTIDLRVSNYTVNSGTYLLARLSNSLRRYEGEIKVYVPPKALENIRRSDIIYLIPKVDIMVNKSKTTYELMPIILQVKVSNYILVGSCSCSISEAEPIELCSNIKVSNNFLSRYLTAGIEIRNLAPKPFIGVLLISSDSSVITSKLINVSSYQAVSKSVVLSALTSPTHSEALTLRSSVLDVNNHLIVNTSINLKLSINVTNVEVRLKAKSTAFAGEQLRVEASITNYNTLPIAIRSISVKILNKTLWSKNLNTILRPGSAITVPISMKLNVSGTVRLILKVSYIALGKVHEVGTNFKVKVIKPLVIRVVKHEFRTSEEVPIELGVFKPLRAVTIYLVKGNKTIPLKYIGDISVPNLYVINLSIKEVAPGNYTLVAISKLDRVRSNEVLIKVLGKSTSKVKGSKEVITKGQGIVKDIVILTKNVSKGSNVSVKVILSKPIAPLNIKVYKYSKDFEPPWILKPIANIRKINDREVIVTFKAPNTVGTHKYRIDVSSKEKLLASKVFLITVSEGRSVEVVKAGLQPEVFYALVATSVLASILLFRRHVRRH